RGSYQVWAVCPEGRKWTEGRKWAKMAGSSLGIDKCMRGLKSDICPSSRFTPSRFNAHVSCIPGLVTGLLMRGFRVAVCFGCFNLFWLGNVDFFGLFGFLGLGWLHRRAGI